MQTDFCGGPDSSVYPFERLTPPNSQLLWFVPLPPVRTLASCACPALSPSLRVHNPALIVFTVVVRVSRLEWCTQLAR